MSDFLPVGHPLSLPAALRLADSGLYPLLCSIKSEESLPLSRPRCQVGNGFLLLSISDDTHSDMSLVAGDS